MITAIRGMKDILPPESERWHYIETVAREVFRLYGYREVRLPLIERTELFQRSIGEVTDIVEKEMYTFPDRHGDSLTLRPEATAGMVRACIENKLHVGGGAKKYFTLGPMFRYERPQKGRYRQFHQINCEALGVEAPELDAEQILLLMTILKQLGVAGLKLTLNSLGCPVCRPAYIEELTALFARGLRDLCDDCQRRSLTNPLRVFDCKNKVCIELLGSAPTLSERLCGDCVSYQERLLALLTGFGLAYTLNPRLVRGLDYYSRTAFEVVTGRLGAQNAVAGGGRYNGLVKALGGPEIPAVGFAIGMERLVTLLGEDAPAVITSPTLFIAALGADAREKGFALLQELRGVGLAADMEFEEKSLKAQMGLADRRGAQYTLILGEAELAAGQAPLRAMATGEQDEVDLSELTRALQQRLADLEKE